MEQTEEPMSTVQERWVVCGNQRNEIRENIRNSNMEKLENLVKFISLSISFRYHHTQREVKDWIWSVSSDCGKSWALRLADKPQRPGNSDCSNRTEFRVSPSQLPDHTLTSPKIHLQNEVWSHLRTKRENSRTFWGSLRERLLKIDSSWMEVNRKWEIFEVFFCIHGLKFLQEIHLW